MKKLALTVLVVLFLAPPLAVGSLSRIPNDSILYDPGEESLSLIVSFILDKEYDSAFVKFDCSWKSSTSFIPAVKEPTASVAWNAYYDVSDYPDSEATCTYSIRLNGRDLAYNGEASWTVDIKGRMALSPSPPSLSDKTTSTSQTVTLQTPTEKLEKGTCIAIAKCPGSKSTAASSLLQALKAQPDIKFISHTILENAQAAVRCAPPNKPQAQDPNIEKIIITLWDPSCGMDLPWCEKDASNYGVIEIGEGNDKKHVFSDSTGTYFAGAGYYTHCGEYDKGKSEEILVVGGHKTALLNAADELIAGLKTGTLNSKIEYKMTEDWAKTAIVAFEEDSKVIKELTDNDKATVIIEGEGSGNLAEILSKPGAGGQLRLFASAPTAFARNNNTGAIDNLAFNLFAILNDRSQNKIHAAELYGCKNASGDKIKASLLNTTSLYTNLEDGRVFVVKEGDEYFAGENGVICVFGSNKGKAGNCEAKIQGTPNCATSGNPAGNFGLYGLVVDSDSLNFVSGLHSCATPDLVKSSLPKKQKIQLCSEVGENTCPNNKTETVANSEETACACIVPETITWKTVPQLKIKKGAPTIRPLDREDEEEEDKDKVNDNSKSNSRGGSNPLNSQTLQNLLGTNTNSGSEPNSTTTSQNSNSGETSTSSDSTGSSVTSTPTSSSAETSSGSSFKKEGGKVTVSGDEDEIEVTQNERGMTTALLDDGGTVQVKNEEGVVTEIEELPPGGTLTIDPGETAELTLDNGDLVSIDSTGEVTIWTPQENIVTSVGGPTELYGNGYYAAANDDGTSTVTNYGNPSFTANYASASSEPKTIWVLDGNGAPIQDAQVYVSADGRSYSDLGTTDGNGQLVNPFLYDSDNAGVVYLAITEDDRAYGFAPDANSDYDIIV